jgi:hypothetical protein
LASAIARVPPDIEIRQRLFEHRVQFALERIIRRWPRAQLGARGFDPLDIAHQVGGLVDLCLAQQVREVTIALGHGSTTSLGNAAGPSEFMPPQPGPWIVAPR